MRISICNNDVCHRAYGDFTEVYCLRTKEVLSLESVAADIWRHIASVPETDLDAIVDFIVSEYDAEAEDVYDDVYEFVTQLYADGILLIDGEYYSRNACEADCSPSSSPDVESQIVSLLEERNQLFATTFEMTYGCNEKCVHCYAHYPGSDDGCVPLRFSDYKAAIDELKEMGCLHLSFTGGDPFVHPDFLEVFEYARRCGFVCDIYTNGLFLAQHDDALSKIIGLRPRAFYISLYGSNAKTHDSVTKVEGSFDKTVNIVKTLRTNDIPVVLNIMVLTINQEDLQDTISLATALGAEYRVSMSLIYRNDGGGEPMDYFIADETVMKSVIATAKDSFCSVDVLVGDVNESDHMCNAGLTSLSVDPAGGIFPCISLKIPLGSLSDGGFRKAWDSEARKDVISLLRWENSIECLSCPTRSSCLHCAGMSFMESGDIRACNTCDKEVSKCILELAEKHAVAASHASEC